MNNVLILLAKRVLIQLGLTTAASGVDAKILKKILGPGTLSLIKTNKEMKDMNKVNPLNDSDLLKKKLY